MKKFLSILISCLLCISLFADDKVVYGVDNRLEYRELPNQYQIIADATAAMIPATSLNYKSNITEGTLKRYQFVCPDEKFYNQRTLANCSGFLVDKDILITAGHCIRGEDSCQNFKWVFNYNTSNTYIRKRDTYSCKKLIHTIATPSEDFAVIQLDREVKDALPLQFRKEGEIPVTTPVYVIGHPSGLPTKFADGAWVRSITPTYFVTNLDTYGGNSGSAVFNALTDEVEGILVRGAQDFVFDSVNKCYRTNFCTNINCRGEDVTNIKLILPYL